MKKIICSLTIFLLLTSNVFSQDNDPPSPPGSADVWIVSYGASCVNLAWDANPEEDLWGYRLYYKTSSLNYENFIDVGNITCLRINLS